jgi:hypothetical protein
MDIPRHRFRQASERGLLRTNTLKYRPSGSQFLAEFDHALTLVSPRERTPIQQNVEFGILGQQVGGSLQHDLLAEIVLSQRVLDLPRLKERRPNCVLIENRAGKSLRERSRQSALTRSRESRHHHDHK